MLSKCMVYDISINNNIGKWKVEKYIYSHTLYIIVRIREIIYLYNSCYNIQTIMIYD